MSILAVLVLIFIGVTIWSLTSSDEKEISSIKEKQTSTDQELTALKEKLTSLENSLVVERNARQELSKALNVNGNNKMANFSFKHPLHDFKQQVPDTYIYTQMICKGGFSKRQRGALNDVYFFVGTVDAFAAVLGTRSGYTQAIVRGRVFKFDVVNVNIRGGYNPNSG